MESAPALRSTTNPYVTQLVGALRNEPDLEVHLFSFRRALVGRFDVFHVHWPESMLGAPTRLKRLRRRLLSLVFVMRLLAFRKVVVRTWHNLELPQGMSRFDYLLLRLMDRATSLRVVLSPLSVSTLPDNKPFVVIPHGHYRDWYRTPDGETPTPDRIGYVGLVRRYKGVETLIEAFKQLSDPALRLHVAGNPSTAELAEYLESLASDDPRIILELRFMSDDEFAAQIAASSLIALPYRHMHNSGTVLAVLSLNRPALVPDNELNRLLAAEVGQQWIYFFDGELSASALADALRSVASDPPQGRPNLDGRDWPAAGRAHADAFRRAYAAAPKGPTINRPR